VSEVRVESSIRAVRHLPGTLFRGYCIEGLPADSERELERKASGAGRSGVWRRSIREPPVEVEHALARYMARGLKVRGRQQDNF